MKARKAHRYKKGIFWCETEAGRYPNMNLNKARAKLMSRNTKETLKILNFPSKLFQKFKILQECQERIPVWKTETENDPIRSSTPYYPDYRSDTPYHPSYYRYHRYSENYRVFYKTPIFTQ